jgi:hypothetical protein
VAQVMHTIGITRVRHNSGTLLSFLQSHAALLEGKPALSANTASLHHVLAYGREGNPFYEQWVHPPGWAGVPMEQQHGLRAAAASREGQRKEFTR